MELTLAGHTEMMLLARPSLSTSLSQSARKLLKLFTVCHSFLLLDDKSCVDNELVLIAWCDWKLCDEKVHTKVSYLKVVRPESVSGQGLFQVLEEGLHALGISSISSTSKLVGIATDGASANIAKGGLRGLVEAKLSWVFWMWCLAH